VVLRRFFSQIWGRACVLLLMTLGLSACGLNSPQVATQIVTIPPLPTNTLAPVVTTTQRFTATPIPTATFIPSATPIATDTPIPPTETPQPPTPSLQTARGAVNDRSQVVNLRSGPSTDFDAIGKVNSGTTLTILGFSDDRQWYFVVADGVGEGWMSAEFVSVANATAIAVAPSIELTRRAESRPAITPVGTPPPTIAYRSTRRTDVLAYCDLPDYPNEAGKKFTRESTITIFWSWYAQTRDQINDHVNYSQYEVTLEQKEGDGWRRVQSLDRWREYRTNTVQQRGQFFVYWYVPVGKLAPGEYRVVYKLTWTQTVDDGSKTFGPGGLEEVNTGTCLFSVS